MLPKCYLSLTKTKLKQKMWKYGNRLRSLTIQDILIKFCIHINIDKIQTKKLPKATFLCSAASHLGLHCFPRPICLNTHCEYGNCFFFVFFLSYHLVTVNVGIDVGVTVSYRHGFSGIGWQIFIEVSTGQIVSNFSHIICRNIYASSYLDGFFWEKTIPSFKIGMSWWMGIWRLLLTFFKAICYLYSSVDCFHIW